MKVFLLAIILAALIPARATAGGVAVNVHALVLIAMLAAAAGGLMFALRPAARPRLYPNGHAHA